MNLRERFRPGFVTVSIWKHRRNKNGLLKKQIVFLKYVIIRLLCGTPRNVPIHLKFFIFVYVLLRSEIPNGICAKLRTVAANNNRVHMPLSLYYCLFAPHISMVLFFTHIPFVVNHTINATPPERLQQYQSRMPWNMGRKNCVNFFKMPIFKCTLATSPPAPVRWASSSQNETTKRRWCREK